MRSTRLFVLLVLAGCGSPAVPGSDAGSGRDAFVVEGDAGPDVDASGSDAGTDVDGGSTTCSPTAGSATFEMSCDLLELAVLRHADRAPVVRLAGRLNPGATGASCAVIDGVDVLEGSEVLQHFDGGASVVVSEQDAEIGRAAPTAALASRCDSDGDRFSTLGIVITGHVDGGTFEARCAAADSGGHWPPELRLTCHDEIEAPPFATTASVMNGSIGGRPYSMSSLYVAVPHDATGAITTADVTFHVIPQRSIFDVGRPLAPSDVGPWTVSVSESGTRPGSSEIAFFSSEMPFDPELCPVPMEIGPDYVPPPVFLARITGTGGHGPFMTEAYVMGCTTIDSP